MNRSCLILFLCSISLLQCAPTRNALFLKAHYSRNLNPGFLVACSSAGFVVGGLPVLLLLYKDPKLSRCPKLVRYGVRIGLLLLGTLGGFKFGCHEQNQAQKAIRRLGL